MTRETAYHIKLAHSPTAVVMDVTNVAKAASGKHFTATSSVVARGRLLRFIFHLSTLTNMSVISSYDNRNESSASRVSSEHKLDAA